MSAPVTCADCGSPMELRNSRFGRFYGCTRFPVCRGTHGAHQQDGRPLGIPANAATKQARVEAHDALDQLWWEAPALYELPNDQRMRGPLVKRLRRVARTRAYRWLAEQLGIDPKRCHVGEMDEATCRRVVEACRDASPATVRAWAKARADAIGAAS